MGERSGHDPSTGRKSASERRGTTDHPIGRRPAFWISPEKRLGPRMDHFLQAELSVPTDPHVFNF